MGIAAAGVVTTMHAAVTVAAIVAKTTVPHTVVGAVTGAVTGIHVLGVAAAAIGAVTATQTFGIVLALGLSYLLGSVPIGYLYARARGVDLRKIGSGNIGATNVYRAFGKGPAIAVFSLDVVKGLAAVTLIAMIGGAIAGGLGASGEGSGAAEALGTGSAGATGAVPESAARVYLAIACGLAAIAGHVASIFMRFKGGKGVATAVGVFLGLAPLATAICLAIWGALFAAFRYVSLGSIAGALALPFFIWLFDRDGCGRSPVFYFALLVAALVVVTHRANIRRLLAGKEHRIGKRAEEAR